MIYSKIRFESFEVHETYVAEEHTVKKGIVCVNFDFKAILHSASVGVQVLLF